MFGDHVVDLCLGFDFTYSLVNLLHVARGLNYHPFLLVVVELVLQEISQIQRKESYRTECNGICHFIFFSNPIIKFLLNE